MTEHPSEHLQALRKEANEHPGGRKKFLETLKAAHQALQEVKLSSFRAPLRQQLVTTLASTRIFLTAAIRALEDDTMGNLRSANMQATIAAQNRAMRDSWNAAIQALTEPAGEEE